MTTNTALDIHPRKKDDWLTDLAFELALRYYTPEELQLRYELTPEQFETITSKEQFKQLQLAAARNIDERGKQFKVLARKLATESLPNLFEIAADQDASHSDRIAAVTALSRFAGFDKQEQASGNKAFQVVFNMGTHAPTSGSVTIDQEPASD